MSSRPTIAEWALALAHATAARSTCLRRKVGCVLVDDRGCVVATGYNGVASGLPHCEDPPDHPHACPGARSPSGTDLDRCFAIHAEANALLQCRDVSAIRLVAVTASPCLACTKLLLNSGAERIVFSEDYPDPEARALWRSAGRRIDRLVTPARS